MPGASTFIEREGGTLETVNGIHAVQLHGSYRAMGRQHAALAATVCGDVVTQYLNGLVEKLIAHAVPPLAAPLGGALKRLFRFRNADRIGSELLEMLAGASEGFGAPQAAAERVLFVPDIVHYLAGRSFVPMAVPPMCSALYARDSATRGGRQLIARNLDFFGRGIWNECNALIVTHPSDGQRVCWIGALGAPSAPQGFNESGIFFGLHTKFTRDVATRGVPLFSLCQRVMAHSTTLDEAIRNITAEPRLCGLSFFLADTRARTAAAVGFSARHHEVVPLEDDVLVRTNHYITPAMQALEIAPHPWQRNSRGRFRRVHELIAARRGDLAPEHVPGILGDCHDPWEGRTRVTGNIVACINTTQSLAMSPDEDCLWLAKGDHPVSHAENYNGFRISALLAGDRAHYTVAPLAGPAPLPQEARAALHEYAEAWSAHLDQLDDDRAVFHLRRAATLQGDEPIFPRMAGILLMRQRRYVQALPLLEASAAYEYNDPLMRAESRMWVARCLDLLGRRTEALAQYQAIAAMNVAPISPAAQRHLQKPFGALDLFEVSPEFICGTAIARYKA